MNEHVNFAETESVMERGDHMVPVFVQDADDYPSGGAIYAAVSDITYGLDEDEDQDDEVFDFEDVEE